MINNKQKMELINCLRSEMTHVWSAAFVLGGGSATLFLGTQTPAKIIIGIIGLTFAFVLIYSYFIRRDKINKIIRYLKED
jgi:intracellular septation protein A